MAKKAKADKAAAADKPAEKKERGRANGCRTLEKRGGIWRARWVVNGKRFTRSTGESDKREAEKRLAEFVAPTRAKSDKERLENLAARISGRDAEIKLYEKQLPALAVADAFEKYRNHPEAPRRAGADTIRMYESQFGRFEKWLKENHPEIRELRHVTKDAAYEFLRYLEGFTSAGTYNKYLALFKSVWSVLDTDAKLEGFNPWAKAQRKEKNASDRRDLTTEELLRIGEKATGELALLIAVGVYTGLRLGDACRLGWGNVDLARNHISVEPSKTKEHTKGKPVIIPLVPPFRKLLLSVPAAKRKGPLVPGYKELYERDNVAVTYRVKKLFESCGIETTVDAPDGGHKRVAAGFHSLRHTFVSIAAKFGVPLSVVQSIVGHTSPAMTRHYTHVHETTLQENVRVFPDVFAPVAALAAPDTADVEAEAVTVGESVMLDADTLRALDTLAEKGETRVDVIRRAVAILAESANGKKA